MVAFLVHILVTAVLLVLIAKLVPGVRIDGGGPAVFGALVLGLANAFVRPILVVLTFPLTVITLGLFLFVINALMLLLAAKLVAGFSIDGFGSALIASLVLSLLNLLIAAVL
jgi:putative membrane protein